MKRSTHLILFFKQLVMPAAKSYRVMAIYSQVSDMCSTHVHVYNFMLHLFLILQLLDYWMEQQSYSVYSTCTQTYGVTVLLLFNWKKDWKKGKSILKK